MSTRDTSRDLRGLCGALYTALNLHFSYDETVTPGMLLPWVKDEYPLAFQRDVQAAMRWLCTSGRALRTGRGYYQRVRPQETVEVLTPGPVMYVPPTLPPGPVVRLQEALYSIPPKRRPPPSDVFVIDALLDALAKAEPVLRRYRKAVEAITGSE